VPNRGWSSVTFKNENIERLLRKRVEGKIIHVLYFGDYDPSGLAMGNNLMEDLEKVGLDQAYEKIALTKSQIRSFRLEHLKNPDPDVLKKLKRDKNKFSFMEEAGLRNENELYQIEVDALQRDPARFKNLVLSAVDKYFDEDIYDNVMNEYSSEDIEELVNRQVQFNDDNNSTEGEGVL